MLPNDLDGLGLITSGKLPASLDNTQGFDKTSQTSHKTSFSRIFPCQNSRYPSMLDIFP